MYAFFMKRLQILIDEELHEALQQQALSEGTSKGALIRKYVRIHLTPFPPLESDPLWMMKGADNFEPGSIDEVVYR